MSAKRYGRMVQESLVARMRALMLARRRRLDALRSRADAEAYVADTRAAIRRCFGPLPPRTPLQACVTGRVAYDAFILEKIVFASRPGFLVTANLYLPRGLEAPAPGVLGLCGHARIGKAEPAYQSFAQGLAQRGFVVLMIDPVEQGERRQYYPGDGGPRPALCPAHNLMGNALALTGGFLGSWFAWDALRGLDYLLSRPEVDPTRVGATGNSGGGTQTSYLTALDPRLTMAAPGCYVGSWLTNLENELPTDSEQNPPGILAAGLDQADLLLAHAPRPTLILAQRDDFFDLRAARAAYADLRRVSALLGAPEAAAIFAGPGGHGYSIENRQAMYAFFMRQAGLRGSARETGVKPLTPRALAVLPASGTRGAGSRRLFEFTAERARALARTRRPLDEQQLRRAAARILGVRPMSSPPHFRVILAARLRPGPLGQQRQFAVESDPGIQTLVTLHAPHLPAVYVPAQPLRLYVGHLSSEADLELPEVRALARGKRIFATLDPRGLGESQPHTCGDREFFLSYGADFLYASTGEMLGEPYVGRRVHDLLRGMDFLLDRGVPEIELAGRGLGAVLVAFAALLHPSRPRVRLLNFLPSFQLLAETPLANWPLSIRPRGVLRAFDLPDVYRVLGRRLQRTAPWGAVLTARQRRQP